MSVRLIQGDCLTEMARLEAGSVDMILCDLPYGTTACSWDAVIPFEPLWRAYRRVAKPNAAIVLTASQPFTSALGASNLAMLRYAWVWEKARPTNFANAKKMPMKGFEDALVFYRSLPTYNPQGLVECHREVKNTGTKSRKNALKANGDTSYMGQTGINGGVYMQTHSGYPRGIVRFAQDAENFHPTQKPVALMEYLIRTYTNPGDTVLDNTCGSGTTLVAAINTGRNAIGIERDPGYFRIASERVRAARGKVEPSPLERVAAWNRLARGWKVAA